MIKIFGSIFLVIGTSMGAGMLSLPLIIANCGLSISIILIIFSWLIMYMSSLKLLKICSNQPLGTNISSLIKNKLPKSLEIIFTIIYLMLLYSLVAAYTTQGTSLLKIIFDCKIRNLDINTIIWIIIFILIIQNNKLSDYTNRFFILIKIIFFLLCLSMMLKKINYIYESTISIPFYALVFIWPTIIPSFGFQNIVPVIYENEKGNIKNTKLSIFIGSLGVLIFYIIWIIVCLLVVPKTGSYSYESIFKNGNNLKEFIVTIDKIFKNKTIYVSLLIFINISVITSLICTLLSLKHYSKDIFKRFNINISSKINCIVNFIPPYIFTIYYPNGFILALKYATIFAVIIFIILPFYLDKNKNQKIDNIFIFIGILIVIIELSSLKI